MAVKTQGTQLYFLDPATSTIMEVGCIESLSGINTTADQIETTCLSSDDREYVAGLRNPGQAQFNLRTDFSVASHAALYVLCQDQTSTSWFVGWSDGDDAPTYSGSTLSLPDDRTWIEFEGYVSEMPFQFDQNSVVSSSVTVQVSGTITVTPSTASA